MTTASNVTPVLSTTKLSDGLKMMVPLRNVTPRSLIVGFPDSKNLIMNDSLALEVVDGIVVTVLVHLLDYRSQVV